MTEPISDPKYWAKRLRDAESRKHLHQAVFKCSYKKWVQIEAAHKKIIRSLVLPCDSVLDAGCGYGRLIKLMPRDWDRRGYFGIDLSPEMVAKARSEYPMQSFFAADLRDLTDVLPPSRFQHGRGLFDWVVLISMKHMVIRNLGEEEWLKMEAELKRVSRRILYLEYDPNDPGTIEELTHERHWTIQHP